MGGDIGPLFDRAWSATEEISLLNAVESAGFGNWTKVAKRMASRTAEECRHHYFKTYIYSKTAPLPDSTTLSNSSLNAKTDDDRPSTTTIHLEPKYRPKHAATYAYYRPKRGDYEVVGMAVGKCGMTVLARSKCHLWTSPSITTTRTAAESMPCCVL
eukprot:TRINITY_DN10545_c0_g1_i3.p1 TRINITY_DN10545_c0_g1~~TRINITY_DN10545_c0_g1_i3.p1  ORF type:complete len:157 (+),score=11.42 TRINITY_DN10545_c0_g1_i3:135-605(+)